MSDENIKGGVNIEMKSKTTRMTIASMIVMGIVGVLAITIILMAIIPKSYAIDMPKDSPIYVRIYKGSTTSVCNVNRTDNKESKEQQRFEKFENSFKDSFKTSSLNALFQKSLISNIEYEYQPSKYLSKIVGENDYVLELVYSGEQTLQKDGKDYIRDEYKESTVYPNGVITFEKLWVTVNKFEGINTVKIYVQKKNTYGYSDQAVIEITTKGLQENLYNTITEIIDGKA